jgi:hypothetical protein
MFGSHQFEAKNIEGSTIPKGTPVYIAGHSGNDPEIAIADADDPAKMPAFGITTAAIANNNKGNVIVFGNYIGLDTSSFSVGDELYVSNTGTLVNTRPSASADKVQKIAKVIRSQSQNGQIFVMGAGRSNDVPNAITTNSINLSSTTTVSSVLDEDTMASNSATALATQQSIKAYVDSQIGSNNELSEILTNGNTTGGNDISFADNDKAVFGAGDDLQIYHDGGNSYIRDTGTGNLKIWSGAGLDIQTTTGENYIDAVENGTVRLYYDNSKKLETTATGVDVTGTVTADGLTASASTADYIASITNSNGTNAGGGLKVQTYWNTGSNSVLNLLSNSGSNTVANFAGNGDISFYEDTGTSAKFFWDASAESLGIGTTSPSAGAVGGTVVHVQNSGGTASVRVDRSDASTAGTLSMTSGNTTNGFYGTGAKPMVFSTNATERMTIDSSGNVGIGTSSPSSFYSGANNFVVGSGSGANGMSIFSGTTDAGRLYFADGTSGAARYAGYVEYGHSDNKMLFGTNGLTQAVIDSSGNVGIGTTSPHTFGLHINKSSGASGLRIQTGSNSFDLTQSGTEVYVTNNTSTGSTIFYNNAAERMRIDSAGSVGIGTASPFAFSKLTLAGTAGDQTSANQQLVISAPTTTAGQGAGIRLSAVSGSNEAIGVIGAVNEASGNSGAMTFHVYNAGATIPEYMRIDSSGRVTMPYQPAFEVRRGGGGISVGSTFVNFSATVVEYDRGGNYNNSTDRFTCPVNGVYYFYFWSIQNNMTNGTLIIRVNGNGVAYAHATTSSSNWGTTTLPLTRSLSAGDYVEAYWANPNGQFHASPYSAFGGYLLG